MEKIQVAEEIARLNYDVQNTNPSSASQEIYADDISPSYLKIDDLPKEGVQVKVLVRNANGSVIVRIPRDEERKHVVKHIAYTNWKTA